MSKLATCFFLAAGLVLGTGTDGLSQQFTGGIRGTVRDANGVIPGAAVVVTNEATSVPRDTVTNAVGEYNFPALAPATYTVRASLPGYKAYERRGIRIATQQFVTLDLPLEVGAIEESITVTADAPLIETSNASQGGVLDRQSLEELPAAGRNAFMIGVTIPTVLSVGEPRFNRQQDQMVSSQLSLGGGGVQANNYTLDGVPITDMRGFPVLNPTIEAIDDVKVQVHTFDAEMGRTGGGVFNTTARSGANAFHGTAFYQDRPVWGQSLEYFSEKRGATKESSGLSESFYHLYGGGIGGPIVKNRTFFWAATEGYRDQVIQGLSRTWPSARQRIGDFSTTTLNGAPVRIFNPYCRDGVANAKCPATGTGSLATGGEFTNAIIPRTHPAANPVAFKMASYWPLPQGSNENSLSNLDTTVNLPDFADMLTFKGEHKFNDSSSLSGLFIYNQTKEPAASPVPDDLSFLEQGANWLIRHPKVFVLNNTNVLSDTLVASFRYGYSVFPDGRNCRGGSPGVGCFSDGLSSLGFNQSYLSAVDDTAENLFPSVSFQNYSAGGQNLNTAPIKWESPITLNAAMSKLAGRHTVKIGGDFRTMRLDTTLLNNTAGSFTFQNLFTAGPNRVGGYDYASFLLGAATSGSVDFNRGGGIYSLNYGGGYIQDDWRVNSRFTLNYGVRFEHESGLRERDNNITVGFDPNATSAGLTAIEAAARRNGYTGPALKGGLMFAGVDGNNDYQGNPPAVKVSPRFGTTWAIDANTVLRGGYGLFYAPWQYTQQSHGTIGFTRSTAMAQSAAESAVPLASLDNPFPSGLIAPSGSSLGILTGVGGNIDFIDQNKGAPKIHQYAVDVQRQLRGDVAVSLGYIGSTGVDIGYGGFTNTGVEINQIDPANLPKDASGRWDAGALRRNVPNPFFGVPGTGELGHQRHHPRGPVAAAVPAIQQRDEVSDDRWRKTAVSRHGRQAGQAIDPLGRTFQLRVQPHDGQPVGPVQHLRQRAAGHRKRRQRRRSAELLRSRLRVLDQHHRYSAPHRALPCGADSRPDNRRGLVVPRRLGGIGNHRVRQRSADLRVCDQPVGREPRAVQRPAAAEPHQPAGVDAGRRSRPDRECRSPDRGMDQRGRVCQSGPGGVRQRAAHGRRQPVSVPQEHRRRLHQVVPICQNAERRSTVRAPEPDERAEIRRGEHRHQQQRVRADYDEPGLFADLATELPLPVLVSRLRNSLSTEGGEAPGWQGAKSEHIGNIRTMSNAASRDASPAGCQRIPETRHRAGA